MAEAGLWGKLDSLFGITLNGPKGNLALWYVHSLMWIFILSPVWIMVARIHRTVLMLAGLALALAVPDVSIPVLSLKLGSIGWFCAGMGSAQLALGNRCVPDVVFAASGICWCALIVMGAMEKAGWLAAAHFPEVAMRFAAPVGIVFWWGLYDRLPLSRHGNLPACFRLTFWVYCLHGVVTGWILAPVVFLLGKSDGVAMLASFLSVCGALVFCLATGLFMKSRFPNAYAVLSGGRGFAAPKEAKR